MTPDDWSDLDFLLFDWLEAGDPGRWLRVAAGRMAEAARWGLPEGTPQAALAQATPVLSAPGHLAVGWLWLDIAAVALDRPARAGPLAAGKLAACRYFFAYEMPLIDAWLHPLLAGDRLLLDTGAEAL